MKLLIRQEPNPRKGQDPPQGLTMPTYTVTEEKKRMEMNLDKRRIKERTNCTTIDF